MDYYVTHPFYTDKWGEDHYFLPPEDYNDPSYMDVV
jgi:hypothetical protein